MRRAAGDDQRDGVIGRVFAYTARHRRDRCSGSGWSSAAASARLRDEQRAASAAMGLLDYYRQFEGMTDEEVNAALRAEADERRRKALARVEPLDLSHTTWPEYPPHHGRQRDHLRRAPRPAPLPRPRRRRAARRARRPPRRRRRAARRRRRRRAAAQRRHAGADRARRRADHAVALLPALPADGARARTAAPCRCRASASTRSCAAVTDAHARRRDLQPQRPDRRAARRSPSCGGCSTRCPSASSCCSTRRCATSPTPSRSTRRWRCSRTTRGCSSSARFSKAWGLAGLRCGYAIGGPGAEPLLARARARARRRRARAGRRAGGAAPHDALGRRAACRRVAAERARLLDALRARAVEVSAEPGQRRSGCAAEGIDGAELAARMARAGVVVRRAGRSATRGTIRAAVHDRESTDRFMRALEHCTGASNRASAPR